MVSSIGNSVPDIQTGMTKNQLFYVCGKLTGHFPVARWLRVVCSFVKRTAEGDSWNDYIGDKAISMRGKSPRSDVEMKYGNNHFVHILVLLSQCEQFDTQIVIFYQFLIMQTGSSYLQIIPLNLN